MLTLISGGGWMVSHAYSGTTVRQDKQVAAEAITPRISDDEQRRAREKARIQRALFVAQFFVNLAALAVVFLTGASATLKRWASRVSRRPVIERVVYVAAFFVGLSVINLPIDFISGYQVPNRYGLVNQSVGGWWQDYLVGSAVGFIIFLAVTLGFYWLVRKSPRRWWAWVTALSVPVVAGLMLITPVFITPLFNTFTPLPDGRVKREVLDLARTHGIPSDDVFVSDASRQSKAVNAYVIGVANTKRIVLYDTLLTNFTPEEIKFVMAHEMGHYLFHHVWKFIAVTVLVVLGGALAVSGWSARLLTRLKARTGVGELSDIASLPQVAFVLMVCCAVAFPFVNTYSRSLEHDADRFAINATQDTRAAVAAFEKLAKFNISELDPGPVVEFLFYDHPTLAKRIKSVREHVGAGARQPSF
jgi:STE24 endopeptidase